MGDEKDHSMGLRLDGKTYQEVQDLSNTLGIKKSQVIKMGIHRLFASEKNNIAERIIIFDKSTFRKLCEFLETAEIEELAEHNAQQYIIKIRQRMLQIGNQNLEKVKLEQFLTLFAMILGKKHWKWVENINWQSLKGEELFMFINHDINSKFSHFLKILFKVVLHQIFQIQLLDEKTILAENQVELHFAFKNTPKE